MATDFSANIEWNFLSNVEITEKIGTYLKQMRLNKNMSQVEENQIKLSSQLKECFIAAAESTTIEY